MEVNNVIKTESGDLYTVQRAEKFDFDKREFLLLYNVNACDLHIGYIDNGALQFVTDPNSVAVLAREFDRKASTNK